MSLYEFLNGGMMQNMPMMQQAQQPMNMFQMMGEFVKAMQNPSAYVCNKFPDIPEDMRNDPDRILSYLQKTRNISDEQLQQTYNNVIGQR